MSGQSLVEAESENRNPNGLRRFVVAVFYHGKGATNQWHFDLEASQ